MVLWPRFIIPLFNTLKPLEDSDLREKLHALSEKTGFKTKEIQVIDGSKRSAHSNAFSLQVLEDLERLSSTTP